jgi:hypothetical protein
VHWQQQRAQAAKAVGTGDASGHQLAECAFGLALQQPGALHDLIEE